jgi:hypothetical protein
MDTKVYLEWRAKLEKWVVEYRGQVQAQFDTKAEGINGCERISRITGRNGREFKSGKTLLAARKWASGCKEIIVADRKGALVRAIETNNCAGNSPSRSA